MSEAVAVALIAAAPPTVAAILGYLANRRSLRRICGDISRSSSDEGLGALGKQIRRSVRPVGGETGSVR